MSQSSAVASPRANLLRRRNSFTAKKSHLSVRRIGSLTDILITRACSGGSSRGSTVGSAHALRAGPRPSRLHRRSIKGSPTAVIKAHVSDESIATNDNSNRNVNRNAVRAHVVCGPAVRVLLAMLVAAGLIVAACVTLGVAVGVVHVDLTAVHGGLPRLLVGRIVNHSSLGPVPWHFSITDPETERGIPNSLFLMQRVDDMHSNFGVHASRDFKENLERQIHDETRRVAVSQYGRTHGHGLEIVECITCESTTYGGRWMSAVSSTDGTAMAAVVSKNLDGSPRVQFASSAAEQTTIRTEQQGKTAAVAANTTTTTSATISRFGTVAFAVPLACQDTKLRAFAESLQGVLSSFGPETCFQFFFTRYQGATCATPSTLTVSEVETLAGMGHRRANQERLKLDCHDRADIVDVAGEEFSRAQALNALHARAGISTAAANAATTAPALLVVMDVDMRLTKAFLRNAMWFVAPGVSAYFPIVFSEYNPESVRRVESFYASSSSSSASSSLPAFSPHRGVWRKYGFGMYAMAVADADRIRMNAEKFHRWGGEDNDFFAKVRDSLHVVRMRERGLIHRWHPKHCSDTSFVEVSRRLQCVGSQAAAEGSPLGLHLMRMEDRNDHLAVTADEDSYNALAVEEFDIIIGVTTSRKEFATRISTLEETWAKQGGLPEGIAVRYFVGRNEAVTNVDAAADRRTLAKSAQIEDAGVIHVMPHVKDDEYPPVRKNAAMLKELAHLAAASGARWVMKSDDDTLVNLAALRILVERHDDGKAVLLGRRGFGSPLDREGLRQAGMAKPYCMGGPGYIMSRTALARLATELDSCVADADALRPLSIRGQVWHSDTVIGLCLQRERVGGLGCWWPEGKYEGVRRFTQNYNKSVKNFVAEGDLAGTVSMHPLKAHTDMVDQFARLQLRR